MIKKCADVIVDCLIKSDVVEEKDKELYSYAVYSLVLLVSPLLLAIGFGLFLNCVRKSMIIVLPFMIVRKYSGGYHTRHLWSCLICSCLLLLSGIVVSFYLECGWLLIVLTIGATVSLICFSPIDNENRVLSEMEKVRYKRITAILITVFVLVELLLYGLGQYTYSVCVSIGIMMTAILQIPCIVKRKIDQKRTKKVIWYKMD